MLNIASSISNSIVAYDRHRQIVKMLQTAANDSKLCSSHNSTFLSFDFVKDLCKLTLHWCTFCSIFNAKNIFFAVFFSSSFLSLNRHKSILITSRQLDGWAHIKKSRVTVPSILKPNITAPAPTED